MKTYKSVVQDWLTGIPMMQQTVLLCALRGPDGISKYGAAKLLLRWLRRCVLLSAIEGRVLTNPYDKSGGSFTGPSIRQLNSDDEEGFLAPWGEHMMVHVNEYLRQLDGLPHHFHMHFMHAAEILGYKHPEGEVRTWWNCVYKRFVIDLHLHEESEAELDSRLGDNRAGWLARSDPATVE